MSRPKLPTTPTPSARRKAWEANMKAAGYVRRQGLFHPHDAMFIDAMMDAKNMTFAELVADLVRERMRIK